jgi:hypothetical protein
MSHTTRASHRLLSALISVGVLGCAELGIDASAMEQVLGAAGGSSRGLDESTVASGLREALRVGTERSVARTSVAGGFLDDPLLHIALPDELDTLARGLRAVGMGSQVDALEVTMNRAAEQASGEAKAVFWQAVSSMSISDAYAILNGPENAATTYFRQRTEGTLRERFSPVVERAMQEVGLYRSYDALVARYSALSLFQSPTVELNRYVTDETLDGLFTVLAQEERRIRTDPLARSSELLRRVFGR